MKPIPHWFKAALGMRIGLAKLALLDGDVIVALTPDELERMQAAHAKIIIGLILLEDFSTRDYAYDRGGEVMSDAEMQEFRYAVWRRGS